MRFPELLKGLSIKLEKERPFDCEVGLLVRLEVVLSGLNGTLVYVKKSSYRNGNFGISLRRVYEVSPQQLKAA
jgi:hypothetical protein